METSNQPITMTQADAVELARMIRLLEKSDARGRVSGLLKVHGWAEQHNLDDVLALTEPLMARKTKYGFVRTPTPKMAEPAARAARIAFAQVHRTGIRPTHVRHLQQVNRQLTEIINSMHMDKRSSDDEQELLSRLEQARDDFEEAIGK